MSTKIYLNSKWFHLILIVVLAWLSVFRNISLATAQGVSQPLYEVQTIYTRDLGMNSPMGATFMPRDQSFFVWGGTMDSLTMTVYGDVGNPVELADLIDNPTSVAFDEHSDSLFFLGAKGEQLAKIERKEIGLPNATRQTVIRFNTRAFELEDAQGLTFDPRTGELFILDAGRLEILVISPHPTLGFDGGTAVKSGSIHRINLKSFTRAATRGIAFNPTNGNLYIGSPNEQKIYELTAEGNVISVFDTSPFLLNNPSTILFAPSSDQTDDLLNKSLYVVDGGSSPTKQTYSGELISNQTITEEDDGRILELSLSAPLGLPSGITSLPSTLVQVIDTSKAAWNPSSPDPSGIDYWPLTGRLLIVDSEVDEMSSYFTGKNVFDSNLSGTLISTCSTTNLSRSGFSTEPSGIGVDPDHNRIYFSDDDRNSIFEVDLGADEIYCTSDDVIRSINVFDLYSINDAEDVAYGQNTIFIAGGTDAEVYMFNLGPDGKLGGDDGPMTHFDTKTWGFNDLEGIGYNADQGTLFIVSTAANDNYLGHITTSGTLISAYSLSFMGAIPNLRSDVAFAPASQNPAVRNIYIASRGIDNDISPQENDGKIWEISLAPTFADVPFDHWAWHDIESLYKAGVTSGCSTAPMLYCPTTTVTRDQMAIFLLRAKHGSSYTPPAPTGTFQDVPTSYWAAAWIERLAAEGITGGCSITPKLYCPTTAVTRDQMAVFLLKAKYGFSYSPPAAKGVFQDVPTDYWAAPWIERLAAEGITGGCSTTPKLYCPTTAVSRDQMAVFLVRTFNLP